MNRRYSVQRRLERGLARIGLVGTLLLSLVVALDIGILFGNDLVLLGPGGLAFEVVEHVLIPLLVLLVPIVAATRWVIRTSLAPLEVAAAEIESTKELDRGYRVDVSKLPEEAVRFASAVNNLLERLDAAAERQESFAADVAHELKTPLAILSLELERLQDPVAHRLRMDVAEMNRLIEQLLMVAQLDAEAAARIPHVEISLARLAAEVAERMAPDAVAEGKHIELVIQEAAKVAGRKEVLAAALRNLVENALRVTGRGEEVKIIVGPSSVVRIQDGGPGIAPERLRQLQRRLKRADHASEGGAGLGLALVARVMEAHGGKLETSPERRELILTFPNLSSRDPLRSNPAVSEPP